MSADQQCQPDLTSWSRADTSRLAVFATFGAVYQGGFQYWVRGGRGSALDCHSLPCLDLALLDFSLPFLAFP